jgi:hypothetical protein
MRNLKKWTRTGFVALFALAAGNAGAVGWSGGVTITNYYVEEAGNALFTTSGNTNPDGCVTSHWLVIDGTQANFRLLYATIVTAVATGSPVTIYYSGCTAGNAYPHITAIAIPANW